MLMNQLVIFMLQVMLKVLFINLINMVSMTSNEVILGEDNIKLSRVRRSLFDIKQWDMERKEEAVGIPEYPRLITRGNKFFNDQRMNIKMFTEVIDIVLSRSLKIDPGQIFMFEDAHFLLIFF